jgi:hypothetical protein
LQSGGSGLGLYISRQLSEMQGYVLKPVPSQLVLIKYSGKIGVKSEYGVGSTFTFYIRTCRTSAPETPELKMQVLDFARVKEELPNACGSGTGIFDINEPPSNMRLHLSLLDTVESDTDGNVSNPDVSLLSN